MPQLKITAPEKDANVYLADPDTNFGSDNDLKTNNHPSFVRYAFMEHDLSLAPPASLINWVRLYLEVKSWGGTPGNVSAYRCTSSWTETGITYNNRPSVSGLLGSVAVSGGSGWVYIDFNLSQFAALRATNYGLRLNNDISTYIYFHSTDAAESHWPYLLIDYKAPPVGPRWFFFWLLDRFKVKNGILQPRSGLAVI